MRKPFFETDFGPREVPKLENLNFHFNPFFGWGTYRRPKSVLKTDFPVPPF